MVGKYLRKRKGFKKVYVSISDEAAPPPTRPDYEGEEASGMLQGGERA